MPHTVKRLLEINKYMIKLLLMFLVLLNDGSEIEDLFNSTSAFHKAGLFLGNYFFYKERFTFIQTLAV